MLHHQDLKKKSKKLVPNTGREVSSMQFDLGGLITYLD